MSRLFSRLPFAVVLAAGCYAGAETASGPESTSSEEPRSAPETSQLPGVILDGATTAAPTSPDGQATVRTCVPALPEAIQQLMRECSGCHGGARARGGLKLETYAQVVAAAPGALVRMGDDEAPMPPSGLWPQQKRATFEAWIAAGTPPAACSTVDAGSSALASDAGSYPAVVDAGTPDAGARNAGARDAAVTDAGPRDAGMPDAGRDEFGGPSMCTSGTRYKSGTGMKMHPGVACISCHSASGGPDFSLAGTVYPTAHEPNDCNGVNGNTQSAKVVITDARGRDTVLKVNASGNFAAPSGIATPYTAKVVVGNKERRMLGAQSNGDCNGCHSESGAGGAPGRIVMPR